MTFVATMLTTAGTPPDCAAGAGSGHSSAPEVELMTMPGGTEPDRLHRTGSVPAESCGISLHAKCRPLDCQLYEDGLARR